MYGNPISTVVPPCPTPLSQAKPPVPERVPSREGGGVAHDGDSQDFREDATARSRGGGPGAGAAGRGRGDDSKHPRSSFASADSLYLQAKEVGGFVTTGSDRCERGSDARLTARRVACSEFLSVFHVVEQPMKMDAAVEHFSKTLQCVGVFNPFLRRKTITY